MNSLQLENRSAILCETRSESYENWYGSSMKLVQDNWQIDHNNQTINLCVVPRHWRRFFRETFEMHQDSWWLDASYSSMWFLIIPKLKITWLRQMNTEYWFHCSPIADLQWNRWDFLIVFKRPRLGFLYIL